MNVEKLEYFHSGRGVMMTFRHRKACPEQYPAKLDRWGIPPEMAKQWETPQGGFRVRMRICQCVVEVPKRRWAQWKAVARLEGRW